MATQWFTFNGGNPSQASSYTKLTGTPSCTNPTEQMCALQAEEDSGQPIITDSLKNEMINSLQHQVDGPNVKLKSR